MLLLFVDGVGIGDDDPAVNPLVAADTPTLDALLGRKLAGFDAPFRHDGALAMPVDATLGLPGLPQSGTGQTALLTGVNAAEVEGRHVTAYPTVALRAVLTDHNLFTQVRAAGGAAALANTYTPQYFEAVSSGRVRHAAITFSALAAGVRLRGIDDLLAERAIFHDLTNHRLREWGYDVPARTPQESGRVLGRLSRDYHFTLFEFFLSDLAAHNRVPVAPSDVMTMLDGLLSGVLEAAALDETLVLMISDHGNLEDVRAQAHTRNPVPALLVGAGREDVGRRIATLTDVAPAIVEWLAPELH
ncbi:MAG: metalloenzyme [bacterium]